MVLIVLEFIEKRGRIAFEAAVMQAVEEFRTQLLPRERKTRMATRVTHARALVTAAVARRDDDPILDEGPRRVRIVGVAGRDVHALEEPLDRVAAHERVGKLGQPELA